jgi:ubiquinone biosynthesis protein
MRIRALGRLVYVVGLLQHRGIDKLLFARKWIWLLRPLMWLNPCFWRSRDGALNRGEHVREVLAGLGPIFVKFGQVLSTREDLLPEDIVSELALLQDQVAPFPGVEAEALVVAALGAPIDVLFKSFDRACLASASVAQVHEAQLLSGESVVVKVIRPDVREKIDRDLVLLRTLADGLLWWQPCAKRYRPHALVEEFARHLHLELDLINEGANASQLGRHFKDSPLLHVPKIYWQHTRENVLVMERIEGVKISHVARMRSLGVNFKRLAEHGVKIFFTQLLRDNFFHADMHPGNIFVDCRDPDQPKYMAVDFGIMGTLSREDQRYIAENLLAFFEQDYQRVAEMHVRSGWVPAGTKIEDFAVSIRSVCEPIFEKPMKDISYAHLLSRLLQTAEKFAMPVQPQLLLLQKTLLNIEGLGRMLYPELDLWVTAKPLLKKWMREQRSPRRFIKQAMLQMPYWRDQCLALPDLLQQCLERGAEDRSVSVHQPEAKSSAPVWFLLGGVFALAWFGAVKPQVWSWVQAHRVDLPWAALACVAMGLLIWARRRYKCLTK